MTNAPLLPLVRALLARRRGWAGLPLAMIPGLALAGPSGGDVVAGAAAISRPDAGTTQIDQHSNSAIINWQQFSVGADEFVLFNQPSSSAVVLNRVIGGSMSEILGQMQANGQVFLVNPMGVLFGQGSRVDVGGLVATTLDISDADFQSGNYVFSGASTAGIHNRGTITADQGFVVLSADQVQNTGLIQAIGGNVVLASAGGLSLDIDGRGLISYQIDQAALSELAGIDNLGQIIADGGAIALHADVARQLAGTVINNEGQLQARGIAEGDGGEIYLTASGGDIIHSGTIDVSGARGGTTRLIASDHLQTTAASRTLAHGADPLSGGFVELSGHDTLKVRGDIRVAGGTLLLDPTDITIGNGANCDATVCEVDLENQLANDGTNVVLIASNSITLEDLSDNLLNGRSGTNSSSLFMGIGSGSSEANFIRGNGGTIRFADAGDSIATNERIKLVSGSGNGQIEAGSLLAHEIKLQAGGTVQAQNLDAVGTRIEVFGEGGAVNLGAVSAVHAGPTAGAVSVDISNSGTGTINIGSITASSDAASNFAGNVFVRVQGDSGNVQLGDITVSSRNTAGAAYADLDLRSNSGNLQADTVSVDVQAQGTTAQGRIAVSSSGDVSTENLSLSVRNDAVGNGSAYGDLLLSAGGQASAGQLQLTVDNAVDQAAYGNLNAQAFGGSLQLQGADLQVRTGSSYLNLYGAQSLNVSGTINVLGGGGTASSDQSAQTRASQQASTQSASFGGNSFAALSSNGLISVGNGITVRTDAATNRGTFPSFSSERISGYAQLAMDGDAIDVTGGLSVEGVGHAQANLQARQDVTVRGDSRVIATAETQRFDSNDSSSLSRSGTALLFVRAGDSSSSGSSSQTLASSTQGHAQLGRIEVRGPSAFAAIQAGRITVGDGGEAIRVETLSNGVDGSGAYSRSAQYGGTYESSRATALLTMLATGSGDSSGILINGTTTISGPEAFASVFSDSAVQATGAIAISGTGYETSGSGSSEQYGGSIGFGGVEPPPLSDGRVRWGGAGLTVGGAFHCSSCGSSEGGSVATQQTAVQAGASSINLQGAVTVSGIGAARADLHAQTVQTTALTVDAASQGYGEVHGSYSEFGVVDPNGSGSYDLHHTISNGGEGAATYGNADLRIQTGQGGSATTGNLLISGGTANASVDGQDAAISVGTVTIRGSALNATAPYWLDQVQYSANSETGSGSAAGNYETEILGGYNVFSIGFDDQLAASILTGDINASGSGLTGVAVQANSITTGSIGIAAASGRIRTDEPRYGENINLSYADAVLLLDATSGETVAQTGAINVASPDAIHLAAQLRSSGDITLSAGALIDDQLPLRTIDFEHPLETRQFDDQDDFELPILPSNALSAAGNLSATVSAGNNGFAISNAVLNADQNLSIVSPGLQLAALTLSGAQLNLDAGSGTLDLSAVSLSGDTVTLASGSALTANGLIINDAGLTQPTGTVSLSAPTLQISGGSLIGAADLTVAAANQLLISGSSLLHGTVSRYSAGTTLSLNSGLLAAQRYTFTSTGGTISFVDTKIGRGGSNAADALDLTAQNLQVSGSELLATTARINTTGASSVSASTLQFGSADWNAGSLSLTGTQASIGSLTARVTQAITLDGGTLSGSTLSLTGGSLVLRGNTKLLSSGLLSLDSQTLQISNSELSGATSQIRTGGAASASNSVLRLGNAEWNAGSLSLSSNTAFASRLTATTSQALLIEGGTLIGDTLNLTGNSVTLQGGARLSGSALTRLQSTGGDVLLRSSSVFLTETGAARIEVASAGSILLENSSLRGGVIRLTAPATSATEARALTSAELNGPSGRIVADENSRIDALALGAQAGIRIDLSRATTLVGNGVAATGADTALLATIAESNAGLVPRSPGPNAAFEAPDVRLGKLTLVGDYLSIKANTLAFSGAIEAPQDLFVHLRPTTASNAIRIEDASGTAVTGVTRYNAQDHLLVFPGTTFAFGGSDYSGQIRIGNEGVVNLGSRATNFVFLAETPVQGTSQLRTAGQVALLGGAAAVPTDATPQVQEFRPQTKQDNLESGGSDEQDEDNDQQGGKQGQSQQGSSQRAVSEESSAEVALECQ